MYVSNDLIPVSPIFSRDMYGVMFQTWNKKGLMHMKKNLKKSSALKPEIRNNFDNSLSSTKFFMISD